MIKYTPKMLLQYQQKDIKWILQEEQTKGFKRFLQNEAADSKTLAKRFQCIEV